jgi:hypothetical protein
MFAVVWPIFGIGARITGHRLEPLTDSDRKQLGEAWISIARQSSFLLFITRWIAGPAVLVDKILSHLRRPSVEPPARTAEKSPVEPKPSSHIGSAVSLIRAQ